MASLALMDDERTATGDSAVVLEAVDRWKACKEFQGVQDERCREDIKFANGDTRNAWQWDKGVYDTRTGDDSKLPCLTINTTRTHNDIIINQMSKNGFSVRIRPTAGKASYKSAQVMENIVRRILYKSAYPSQRRKVIEQQVDGGIGYILIETAYVSERSFDQDIFLKASRDPTAVYLDPWITEPDGSDANFGFVFERMPRKEFNRKYPKYKNKVGTAPLDAAFGDWISDKEIMLAKYYRKKERNDLLVAYKAEDGGDVEKLASEIKKDSGVEIFNALMDDIKEGRLEGRTRKVVDNKVEWFLIAGNVIIDDGDWAGKYIPICRCVGRELVIDAMLDRKGHTRPLIDANRMLNYNASMAVEIVALQPKSPFMAPARSIEGQEQYKTLNINGFPVILYNDIDDEADGEMQKIAPPFRLDPPKPSQAHDMGMQTAERHSMMISGQFNSQIDERDKQNPSSGVAINERKESGDTATYHFNEHRLDMERFIGVQLLDLIRKIYDTERALHILDEKGEKSWIMINPNQEEVIKEIESQKEDEEAVKLAFNPSIGEYECISDPGPDERTQRQAGWDALKSVMQANNEIANVGMDLLFKFGDFPGADELAERYKLELKAQKPYLFEKDAEPALLAAQEQNKRLIALNSELMTKLADEKLKSKGYNEKRNIDAFNAETKRMQATIDALAKLVLTPAQQAQMQHEVNMQSREDIFSYIAESNAEVINSEDTESEAALT